MSLIAVLRRGAGMEYVGLIAIAGLTADRASVPPAKAREGSGQMKNASSENFR